MVQVAQPSQFAVHFEESTEEPLNSSANTDFQLPAMPRGPLPELLAEADADGDADADGLAEVEGEAEALLLGFAVALAEVLGADVGVALVVGDALVGAAVADGLAVRVADGVPGAAVVGAALGVDGAEALLDGEGLGVTVEPLETNDRAGARLCHTFPALYATKAV
ncbi:hypothetical protein GCM10025734_22910 [Kitasatospora paranensis]